MEGKIEADLDAGVTNPGGAPLSKNQKKKLKEKAKAELAAKQAAEAGAGTAAVEETPAA